MLDDRGAPVFTRQRIEERASDARELLRAQELIARKRVTHTCFAGRDFCATVRGTGEQYDVRVTPTLDGSSCSCPAFSRSRRGFCKHVAAVAMMWLGEQWDTAAVDTELVGAIEILDLFQARQILLEAAGRSRGVRNRIMRNTWSDEANLATAHKPTLRARRSASAANVIDLDALLESGEYDPVTGVGRSRRDVERARRAAAADEREPVARPPKRPSPLNPTKRGPRSS